MDPDLWLACSLSAARLCVPFLLQCPVAQNTKGGVIVVNSPPLMQGKEGNGNTGDLLLFPPPLCPSPQSSLLSRAFNGCGRRHKRARKQDTPHFTHLGRGEATLSPPRKVSPGRQQTEPHKKKTQMWPLSANTGLLSCTCVFAAIFFPTVLSLLGRRI